jgi:hypothetical protein
LAALCDGAPPSREEPLRVRASRTAHDYLDAKARAGHTVAPTASVAAAALPERVSVIRPEAARAGIALGRLAAYLPARAGADAAWFRTSISTSGPS